MNVYSGRKQLLTKAFSLEGQYNGHLVPFEFKTKQQKRYTKDTGFMAVFKSSTLMQSLLYNEGSACN